MEILLREDIEHITDEELEQMLASLPAWRRQTTEMFKSRAGRCQSAAAFLLLQNGLHKRLSSESPATSLSSENPVTSLSATPFSEASELPQFAFGKHGKPFFQEFPDIHFNLSHCRCAAICVISDSPVGVDIETPRHASDALLRYTMNETERAQILASKNPDHAFSTLWTKKEAVQKLTGEGVNHEMHDILLPESLAEKHIQLTTRQCDKYIYSIAQKFILLACFLTLLFLPEHTLAQSPMDWEEFVEYITEHGDVQEELGEEDGKASDGEAWQAYLEELQQLHTHPVNVNTATPAQLRSIPLLNEKQIEDIIKYVWSYQGMHTLYELLLLPSISYYERRYLPLFLTVGTDTDKRQDTPMQPGLKGWLKNERKSLKQEFLTRVDIPFYHRKGFLQGKYRGSPIYNKDVYCLESRHISASLHAERDAGERGIDSYGGQLILSDLPLSKKHKQIRLQRFVVGDYRVTFGQGLLLNQGFSMGKTFTQVSQGIRAQRGTDEMNFMRGIATTISLGDFSFSALYSHRQWDATLTTFSAENTTSAEHSPAQAAKTIVRTGYHRTGTEYEKKGNLGVTVIGGHASWYHKGLSLGTTGYFLQSDKPFERGEAIYRRGYPQGNHFGGVSVDYAYSAYQWRIWGETACAGTLFPRLSDGSLQGQLKERRSGLASLNGFAWNISAKFRLTVLQRYYNRLYHSFFSNAPSESGGVRNETGGTIRLDTYPTSGLRLSAYFDLFRSPWPRYGVQHSSTGWDVMSEAALSFSRSSSLNITYRAKSKEVSSGEKLHHRVRAKWTKNVGKEWRFTTTAMLHALRSNHGEAIGQAIKYTQAHHLSLENDSKPHWQFSLSGLYFHTKDFESRITNYEPNITGMMYYPSFSGHGIRAAGVVQCQLWQQRLRLELKYSVTRYFDRETQGSALQTIYSPVKNDLILQARYTIKYKSKHPTI